MRGFLQGIVSIRHPLEPCQWTIRPLCRKTAAFLHLGANAFPPCAAKKSTRACRSGCPVNADSVLAQTLVLSGQAEGAQGLEGGHDNIDVVDDGAACGEHAGDIVEQLANIQEHVPSVASVVAPPCRYTISFSSIAAKLAGILISLFIITGIPLFQINLYLPSAPNQVHRHQNQTVVPPTGTGRGTSSAFPPELFHI